jgi:hypothetical protein
MAFAGSTPDFFQGGDERFKHKRILSRVKHTKGRGLQPSTLSMLLFIYFAIWQNLTGFT